MLKKVDDFFFLFSFDFVIFCWKGPMFCLSGSMKYGKLTRYVMTKCIF